MRRRASGFLIALAVAVCVAALFLRLSRKTDMIQPLEHPVVVHRAPAPARYVDARFSLCEGPQYHPDCVVDGDTIHLDGVRIRLEDIDAPEIHDPRCASELALGERAKMRLLQLVNMGGFDLVQRGDRDVDIYGRELRTLLRDGHSLGGVLVQEGLARAWDGARHPWC